ncbi:MAG: Crp/Fnr family transcriptional regulator [Planctomycetia bacterium]|nr:Crp/Fnr family transcriptional regulator [Planctomycetia bacterium]
MAERLWYVKKCRLFERLSAEQLGRLENRARVRSFAKNTPVYLPSDDGDAVFVLAEGRVKLCNFTPDGKQAILAFIEPGELFGEQALLEDGPREEHAETVLASTIIQLPADELQRLMAQTPELTLGITRLIGFRRKRIERRLKSLLFRSNRERLVQLLLDLAEQYGRPDEKGLVIDIKLSHQDLASVIGSTRESVTLLLGQLQLEGHLKVARQRIVVRDMKRLVAVLDETAGGDRKAETRHGENGGLPRRAAPPAWCGSRGTDEQD